MARGQNLQREPAADTLACWLAWNEARRTLEYSRLRGRRTEEAVAAINLARDIGRELIASRFSPETKRVRFLTAAQMNGVEHHEPSQPVPTYLGTMEGAALAS